MTEQPGRPSEGASSSLTGGAGPAVPGTSGISGPGAPAAGPAARLARPVRRKGPSKQALAHAKLATIAVATVAFAGALFGVIRATPNTIHTVALAQQASASQPAAEAALPGGSYPAASAAAIVPPLSLPAMPQAPILQPSVRTRGS